MSDLAWMRPKLMTLCGLDPLSWGSPLSMWRPDEDVAQAIRCLEALRPSLSWSLGVAQNPGDRFVCIASEDEPGLSVIVYKGTISQATCLAIAVALGWEKET